MIEITTYYDKVLDSLKVFDQAKETIKRDQNLSDIGRKDQLAKLAVKVAEYKKDALTWLKSDWSKVTREYKRIDKETQEAQEAAAKAWDFQRLSYLSNTVQAAMERSQTLTDFMDQYSKVVNSSDTHTQRAWAELGPIYVKDRWPGEIGRGAFVAQTAQDLAKLLDTPKLAALRKDAQELGQKVITLNQATQQAAAVYEANYGGVWSLPGDFTVLSAGWSISPQSFDSDKQLFVQTVSYSEPQAQAEAQPAGEAAPASAA